MNLEQVRAMCHGAAGTLRPKAECRAELINKLILDEGVVDIDEAEDKIDKMLRELNLWNEPTLEELLKEDEKENPPVV